MRREEGGEGNNTLFLERLAINCGDRVAGKIKGNKLSQCANRTVIFGCRSEQWAFSETKGIVHLLCLLKTYWISSGAQEMILYFWFICTKSKNWSLPREESVFISLRQWWCTWSMTWSAVHFVVTLQFSGITTYLFQLWFDRIRFRFWPICIESRSQTSGVCYRNL